MAVPTSFSDLSTTAASNSPSGSETPAEGDNHFRIGYAFLRSIMDNSGNGWVSPYWALTATGPSISATTVTWSGNPTHSGNHIFSGNVTVQGNTVLGNAGTDTVTTNGNVSFTAPSSGVTAELGQSTAGPALRTTLSNSGGTNGWHLINTSNTSSSDALVFLSVGGSSAGDPITRYNISAIQDWCVGVDNSDSDTYKIDASVALSTSTNRFNVTTDGRIYGNALHNNAGAVTGTTNQYIASGTWTPTTTNVSNIDSSSASAGQWTRVGNVVTWSVELSVNTTSATTSSEVGISLPIASDFASTGQCVGTASPVVAAVTSGNQYIDADTTNNRMRLKFTSGSDTGGSGWYATGTYLIV